MRLLKAYSKTMLIEYTLMRSLKILNLCFMSMLWVCFDHILTHNDWMRTINSNVTCDMRMLKACLDRNLTRNAQMRIINSNIT
jgi:hypothetical protein